MASLSPCGSKLPDLEFSEFYCCSIPVVYKVLCPAILLEFYRCRTDSWPEEPKSRHRSASSKSNDRQSTPDFTVAFSLRLDLVG